VKKQSFKTKKLNFEKLEITKLDNQHIIKGGNGRDGSNMPVGSVVPGDCTITGGI